MLNATEAGFTEQTLKRRLTPLRDAQSAADQLAALRAPIIGQRLCLFASSNCRTCGLTVCHAVVVLISPQTLEACAVDWQVGCHGRVPTRTAPVVVLFPSVDHFQQSPGARRTLKFEPGHALDHHVVLQSVLTSRAKTSNGHLDLNLFAGSDITRQRSAAQVFSQDFASSIADLEPDCHLSAEASSPRLPSDAARVRDS